MAGRSRYEVVLSEPERAELEHRAAYYTRPLRWVSRAKLVLLAVEGTPTRRSASGGSRRTGPGAERVRAALERGGRAVRVERHTRRPHRVDRAARPASGRARASCPISPKPRLSGTASAHRTAVPMRRKPARRGERTGDGLRDAARANTEQQAPGTTAARPAPPDRIRASPSSATSIVSAERELLTGTGSTKVVPIGAAPDRRSVSRASTRALGQQIVSLWVGEALSG
jgi:hypothetical protein